MYDLLHEKWKCIICRYWLVPLHSANAVSYYSLFPLLFEAQEYPIKVTLLLLHCLVMWFGFSSLFSEVAFPKSPNSDENPQKTSDESTSDDGRFEIGWIGKGYLLGLVAVETWGQFLHPLILGDTFPFLPLMLISVYCALGITCCWLWQLRWIIKSWSASQHRFILFFNC